jgi:probable HAF family extracellular repeat protein
MLVVLLFMTSGLLIIQPASAAYVAEDIGCSGYWELIPGGINDADQVAAWRIQTSSGVYQDAVVYDRATETWTVLPDFGTEPALYSRAFDINNDGEVVGMCIQSTGLPHRGAYWPAGYDKIVVLEPLPEGTPYSTAYAVNDLHEAVGCSWTGLGPHKAVQWSLDPDVSSIMPLELGYVLGMDTILPRDINNNHEVVGVTYNSSAGIRPQGFYCAGYGHGMQLLPHLSAGGIDGPYSDAHAISDSGLIVGTSDDLSGVMHAVVWTPPYITAPIDLGLWLGVPSVAFDISTNGKIVGSRGAPSEGFVYDIVSGVCESLPTPPGLGYSYALGVNDVGHVVGIGPVTPVSETDYEHAVLWTPDAPPVAAFTATVSGFIVTVNASASYDAEGEIASYAWDFGDGTYGDEVIMTHAYEGAGPYTITLSVTDSAGQSDFVSLQISTLEKPETEIAELIVLIEECISFDQDVKDRLVAKVTHALDLIEARKTHGATGILLAFDNLVSNYVLVGKIADEYEAWDLIAKSNFVISLLTENHMIAGVPLYTWYHGCGPTAAGMLVGYWDSMGFGDLVAGPQGNEMYQSSEVNAMIASQGHIDDYVYPLDGWIDGVWVDIQDDNSTHGGAHPDDCVADFMHTSRSADGLVYGQSYADMVDEALMGYTDWASGGRYVGTASTFHQGSMSWADLQAQVDVSRPMVFVVDWNGDGESDHLVTVVGYCEIGKAQMFAFYSTWDNNVWWALFDIMKEGNFYGVFAATTFSVANAA